MTQTLAGHLFITLKKEKKIDPQTEKLLKWKTHSLCLALSSLQTCPSLITKVGEQLADYFPCGGFVVTDQGAKVFRQSGVSGAQTRDFRHGVLWWTRVCLPQQRWRNTQFWPLDKKAAVCFILQISNPAILNLELFHCSATSSQIKSNDLDNFQNWQKWWD